jgi:hypothetical protein
MPFGYPHGPGSETFGSVPAVESERRQRRKGVEMYIGGGVLALIVIILLLILLF